MPSHIVLKYKWTKVSPEELSESVALQLTCYSCCFCVGLGSSCDIFLLLAWRVKDKVGRAPCKGGISQWTQIPVGNVASAGSNWSSHGEVPPEKWPAFGWQGERPDRLPEPRRHESERSRNSPSTCTPLWDAPGDYASLGLDAITP